MSYIKFNNGSGGTPGADIRTLTGNSGGAISPDASYNIDIVGAGAVTVTGSGNTLTITDSGAVSAQFDTDSGSATPALNILNVLGSHGLNTTGSGDTVTVLVDNTLVLGDLSSVGAGTDSLTLTTGDLSLTTGVINLASTAATTGYINIDSVVALHSSGTTSIFAGDAGTLTNTGTDNVGMGASALNALASGNYNVSIGAGSLSSLTSGSSNIVIGRNSGTAITNENNNIYIGNAGSTEAGKIRIGTNAVHDGCYIAGIDTVDVGNVVTVVTESSDQLGTADITAGTGVSVAGTANTITISAAAAVPTQFDTDSGSAVPAANVLDIVGSHNLNTTGATNVVTVLMDNEITLGDLSGIAAGDPAITLTTGDIDFTTGSINFPTTTATAGVIFVNANRFMHAYGTSNTFLGTDSGNFTHTTTQSVGVGEGALDITTSGDRKVAVGYNAMGGVTSGATDSIAIGFQCMNGVTTAGTQSVGIGTNCFSNAYAGIDCVAIGYQALDSCTSSDYCIAIGSNALGGLSGGGDNNIAIGNAAGSAYTTESNNITIGSTGTGTDSGVIRLGTNATHTSAFITGIDGVNVGNVVTVVTEASDQLGTADITAGTGIGVAGTANTITISSSATTPLSFPTDSGTATPAANALTVSGGTLIDTAGAGAIVTVNAADAVVGSVSTDGSAATPTSNAFTIAGGTLIASSGAGATVTIDADDTVVASVATDGSAATPSGNAFTIAGGTNVTTSGSGSTVTIDATADKELTYISTTDATYTVLSTDQFVSVDASGGAKQVNLPNTTDTGRVVYIKDQGGDAGSNNIIVTTPGGSVTIDGSTTFVMNTAYQSIAVIFNGTNYEVF